MDFNRNGRWDPAAGESGLQAVVLYLFQDNGNDIPDSRDPWTGLLVQTTQNGQFYFSGLPAGNYWVSISGYEFLEGYMLEGWTSSGGTVQAPDPDDDVDDDDNGTPINISGWPMPDVISGIFTLVPGTEPTSDGDGNNSNLTVDFGFEPPGGLGGQVFHDINNDGVLQEDGSETGLAGVELSLYRDTGNDLPDAGDTRMAGAFTSSGGHYRFLNVPNGKYWVLLPGRQFTPPNPWGGWTSSLGSALAPDPDNDVDSDDNGTPMRLSGSPAPDIVSSVIEFQNGTEPTQDGDGSQSNLTLDFGLVSPVSLKVGGRVFQDLDDDGRWEPELGETGLPGIIVRLGLDDGDGIPEASELIGLTTITGTDGTYSFDRLGPGDYWVAISGFQPFPGQTLYPWRSSLRTSAAPDPDDDVLGDDNGMSTPEVTHPNMAVWTLPVTLAPSSEPILDGDGPDSNQTLDFGLVRDPTVHLGGQVFRDLNRDGVHQPLAGEPGVPSVALYLFRDNGNGIPEASDTYIGNASSSSSGHYVYENLLEGDYWVSIPGYQFEPGHALYGWSSSLGNASAPDPDNDVDGDDNGKPINISGWSKPDVISGIITLKAGSEPTLDGGDAFDNLTLDFGLEEPIWVALGGTLFLDANQNGQLDHSSAEAGLGGLKVYLFRDRGDGVADMGDTYLGVMTTEPTGSYKFTQLAAGDYWISISGFQFLPGFAFWGWKSSLGDALAPDPDNNIDGDDNGTPINISGWPHPDVVSGLIHLEYGTEPTSDGDGANDNSTLDFGLVPPLGRISVGNQLFWDKNRNSRFDPAEDEVGLTAVRLYIFQDLGDGSPDSRDLEVQLTSTDALGRYAFSNLIPGDYWISVSGYQFLPGSLLHGWTSSPGWPNPNDDVDGDDNGDPVNISGWPAPDVITRVFRLSANAEPTDDGDGPNGNLTFDFGLIAPNRAPSAGSDEFRRPPGKPFKISIASLLRNDNDPDGDPIRWLRFSEYTSQGGTVQQLSPDWLVYTPATQDSHDSFQYWVADSSGVESPGHVLLMSSTFQEPTPNLLGVTRDGPGFRVRFAGIPGVVYTIEASLTLSPPSWYTLGVALVGPDGVGLFTDPEPLEQARYYRTVRR